MSDMRERARQLLAEASVISEASAMTFDPSVSHGKAEDSAPRSGGQSTLDWMVELFNRARTDDELHAALRTAEQELEVLRGQRRPKPVPDRVRVLQWEGHKPKEVASVLCVHFKTVEKWRRDAGRDPQTGKALRRAA